MAQIPKSERNAQILALRQKDKQTWTLKKLGDQFNISYVMVHKILKREGKKLSTGGQYGACTI